MIKVYDAMMGSGKTTRIIKEIQEAPETQKFMFITPLLSECHRIAGTIYDPEDPYKRPIIIDSDESTVQYVLNDDAPLKDKLFKHPYFYKGGKAESLPQLIQNKDNIVSTHQLFVNLTPKILQGVKEYTLIIDEMLSVYDVYDVYKKEEIDQMFKNKWISLDEDGITLRFHRENYGIQSTADHDTTENTYYETFATLCDLGQLMLIDGKVVIWELAIDTLKAFKEVWIATYLFEDNIMATYLQAHGMSCEIIRFGKKPSEIKHLVNVYEDTARSKLNRIGEKEGALSFNKFDSTELKDEVKSNLDNFIRNKVKAKKDDIIWTCYKKGKSRIQGTRYGDQWLPFNTKATNSFGDRHTVAYLCNLYPNKDMSKASAKRGFTVKEDVYALAEMVQFIWRSAIRNGEAINLYIPSKRMRTLLQRWLNDEYEK